MTEKLDNEHATDPIKQTRNKREIMSFRDSAIEKISIKNLAFGSKRFRKFKGFKRFRDLEDLKQKLKTKKLNHELCILNAGTMGEIEFASEITDEDFLDTLKINVVANKIIIDWSVLNGCKNFIGISSGAAIKNYDGWLNYCVSKSAFRSMFLQYQKDLPKFKFKLISPGILNTEMNKKIKVIYITGDVSTGAIFDYINPNLINIHLIYY